ncbi:MFS transporter [Desulfurispora thermophila]|uniref:MFS transporter n=1 Tax=Desulfurispora thermophila TaxID=265470 RepID=UPI0003764D4B|nr:MFS transporter [Desulfurispora thermophila]
MPENKTIRADQKTIIALSSIPLIMVLGNSMLIPVLPAIKSALGISQLKTSLLITLFSVPAGLVIPLAGFLSDRIGRKKVIIPSLALYAAGGILAAAAGILLAEKSFPLILTGRVLQGLGAAGTAPIAMALCGDLFTGAARSRVLGIIEASNGLGKVLSPVLGAALGLITWYAAFLFFPLVILPAAIILFLWVEEPRTSRQKQSVKQYARDIAQIFTSKSRLLISCFAGGMTALLVLFGVLFFLSEHLEKTYRLTGISKGLALAIPVLIMSLTSYLTGRIIKKRAALMRRLILSGLLIISASLLVLTWNGQQTWFLFGGVSGCGLGTGLTLPCLNMLITSTTAAAKRGMVTSLYGSVRFFGVAAGPPLFGWLMKYNLKTMFFSGAGLGAAAFVLAWLFIKPEKQLTQVKATPAGSERPGPSLAVQPARKPDPGPDSH